MLKVTFAMNLGWPSNRDECAHPVIHQSTHDVPGNLALYNAVYRPISGDAAPASLFALDRHVRADVAAAIQGSTFGHDVKDLPSTLHASISASAPTIHASTLLFGATDFQAELEQCTVAWKAHPPDASY